MSKDNGGPAFAPYGAPHPTDAAKAIYGMSLRDWFAGQALTAVGSSVQAPSGATLEGVCAEIARASYMVADAMLAERSKP